MNTFAKTLCPFGLILLSGCASLEPGYSYNRPYSTAYHGANAYQSGPQITLEKTAGQLTPTHMPYQYALSYRITVSNRGQYTGRYTLTDALNFPGTLINAVSFPRHLGPDPLSTFIESAFIGQGEHTVLISNETIAPGSSESFSYTVTFTVNDTYLAGTCPTAGLFSETALSGYAQDTISTCTALPSPAYSGTTDHYTDHTPTYYNTYPPEYYNGYPPSVWSSESYYLWPSYQYGNGYYGRPHPHDSHGGTDHHPPHERPDTHFNPPTRIIETQRPVPPPPVPSRFVEEPRPVPGQPVVIPNRPAIRNEPAQLMPQPSIIRTPPTPQPRQEMPSVRHETMPPLHIDTPAVRHEPAPQPRMETPTMRREPTPQPRMEAPAMRREPTPQPRMEAPTMRREPTPQPRMEAPAMRREPTPQPRMKAPTMRREPAPQPRMEAPRPPANNPNPGAGNRKGK